MTDIVLVRPGIEKSGENRWNRILPLGLAYLAAITRAKDRKVKVVDGRFLGHRSTQETVRSILQMAPRFVGVSAMTVEIPRVTEILAGVKRVDRRIVTILGGPHANALPQRTLAEIDQLDFVLAGEVCDQLVQLMDYVEQGTSPTIISGLCWRECGKIRGPSNSAFLRESQVKNLPWPAWDLFPRADAYPIITQFGCPFRCVFCCHNSTQKMRYRSITDVLNELEWLDREYRPRAINFIDENFGLKQDRTEELLIGMVKMGFRNRVRFSAQSRIDLVSENTLRLMKEAGFEFLELGVESGDSEVLEKSCKDIHLEKLHVAMDLANRIGLKVWLKFILGLPGESEASVRRSINLAVRLNPYRLSVATIVPYPGSQIYNWALHGENGYRLLTSDWRAFDKYMGASLVINGISLRKLKRMQAQMYVEVLLRNGRICDLFRLVSQHRSLTLSFMRSFLGKNHAN